MKIVSIFFLFISITYLLTKPYSDRIDSMLKLSKLSTFNALWLSYIEGIAIGALAAMAMIQSFKFEDSHYFSVIVIDYVL